MRTADSRLRHPDTQQTSARHWPEAVREHTHTHTRSPIHQGYTLNTHVIYISIVLDTPPPGGGTAGWPPPSKVKPADL